MPEIIKPFQVKRPPRVAVIDFDGTLSLIRSGWVEIMVDMIVDVLTPLPGTTESVAELTAFVSNFVLNLNGRPTIFQMDYFVNAARERGGNPESPEDYTQQFLDALLAKARQRITALQEGRINADDLLVPGARALLTNLKERGVQMTLASGTAVKDVRREAELLDIDHFFEGRIFGPGENSREFSKMAVMRQMLADARADGSELIGLGDGFIEIENAYELGGIAVGCATDEIHRSGNIEEWKRTRLIQAGAHIIVPDYRNWRRLTDLLFTITA
jgi:phosphoglycolate phosphatase-like HAD superfamily hydrolase